MSEITVTAAQLQRPNSDANTTQNRNQPGAVSGKVAADPPNSGPVDTVEISPAAQASAGQGGDSILTDDEAQTTAAGLRQQLGTYGLSASAKQNAAVLALIRPIR